MYPPLYMVLPYRLSMKIFFSQISLFLLSLSILILYLQQQRLSSFTETKTQNGLDRLGYVPFHSLFQPSSIKSKEILIRIKQQRKQEKDMGINSQAIEITGNKRLKLPLLNNSTTNLNLRNQRKQENHKWVTFD